MHSTGSWESEMVGKQMWFLGLVLTIPLVIGGVELNPGPPADQILSHVKSQARESEVINELLEKHNQEIVDLRNEVNRPQNCFRYEGMRYCNTDSNFQQKQSMDL